MVESVENLLVVDLMCERLLLNLLLFSLVRVTEGVMGSEW